MTNELLAPLAFVAALGAGVVAGVFYAFSTFVMKALARRPHPEGMAAMQSINVAVINPMFLGVFPGTAATSAGAVVAALLRLGGFGGMYLLVGGAFYLLGTFGVTPAFNVPLNNALAGVSGDDPDGSLRWEEYVRRWTAWNHVRTAAALAAAGCSTAALQSGVAGG